MHALLRREGWDIGRDQTARLMKLAGVRGVARSKKVLTTKSDPTIAQPMDLVERDFTAPAPNRLWVADITYVGTWAGMAYVAFVIDVFSRMIVGWNVAGTLRAKVLPLQALNMAAWGARGSLDDLVHHADHGSNYLSVVYTDRINELGATPSTGSVGDSYDNALAEAVNGLYNTELIHPKGPWRTVEQVELVTLVVRVVVEQRSSPRRARSPHAGQGRGGVLRRPRISPASARWTGKQVGTKPRAIHSAAVCERMTPPPLVRRQQRLDPRPLLIREHPIPRRRRHPHRLPRASPQISETRPRACLLTA